MNESFRIRRYNKFIDKVKSIKNGEFEISSGYYEGYDSIFTIKHTICNSEFSMTVERFLDRKTCPYCMSLKFSISTKELFEKELYNKYSNDYILIGDYFNSKTKIKIFHSCGFEWDVLPHNVLKFGCPRCAIERRRKFFVKTQEQFEKEILELGRGEYKMVGEYTKNSSCVDMMHLKCGNTWKITPGNFIRGRRCPYCKQRSIGEKRIERFLFNKNIEYKTQFIFDDCRSIYPLSFDFCVFMNEKILIEFQGIQHYEPVKRFGGVDTFIKQQMHDGIKKQYSENNGIKLIEIPYYEMKNIEKILEKELPIS